METNNHSHSPPPACGSNGEPARPAAVDEVLSVEVVAVELSQAACGVPRPAVPLYHHQAVSTETDHAQHVSTQTKTGTGGKLAIAAIVLVVLLGVGFAISYATGLHRDAIVTQETATAAAAPPVVDVVEVRPTIGSYPITLPGQTAGWYQSVIYSRVDGYVAQWSADMGDRVKQGQVLATIETPELDQQLNAARAKAQATAQEVNVAETNVSIAKITFDRWWESPKGVVSEQERQEKKADYDSAKAKLAAAQAQAKLDEAEVDRLSAMKAFDKVVAPYEGVIIGRHIDIGDLVTAGSTANTSPLYDIAQANIIRAYVDVPQKVAGDIAVGLPAQVTSDQFPGKVFQGKVARSARSIDPQSRTLRTEVDIPNPDLTLVPGMYAEVTFQLKQKGLMNVPASAILFRPEGLAVAEVGADGKISFHPVTVAKDDGQTLEVSAGVKRGDRVALNLSSEVTSGEKVDAVDTTDKSAPPAPPIPAVYIAPPKGAPHLSAPSTQPSRLKGAAGPGPVKDASHEPTLPPAKGKLDHPGAAVGGMPPEFRPQPPAPQER